MEQLGGKVGKRFWKVAVGPSNLLSF